MDNTIKNNLKLAGLSLLNFVKWIFAASLVGAIGAVIGGAFHILLVIAISFAMSGNYSLYRSQRVEL